MTRGHHDLDRPGYLRAILVRLLPDSLVHGRPPCRAVLAVTAYGLLTSVLTWVWSVTPALALVSATGHVRVISQPALNALSVAQRSLQLTSLSSSMAVSTGSVALRMVTGPVGWASLGVTAGLVLAQIYYNAQQVAAIKAGAAPPSSGFTWPQYTGPGIVTGIHLLGNIPIVTLGPVGPDLCVGVWTGIPPGWGAGSYQGQCALQGPANTPASQLPQPIPAADPTPTQISTYLNQLPATDPQSIDANTTGVGVGQSPLPSDATISQPVNAPDVSTTVKPLAQVSQTDVVVNPNEPKPAGVDTTQTGQQTSTTTTTTTNPDGSTTQDTDTQATVSCSSGNHDQRSFGSVLESHMTIWQGSGIAGTLNLLKTLSWPSTLPVISISSGLWGNHAIDFNQWASVFLALRTLIIAGAGFAAYRIVFVGK